MSVQTAPTARDWWKAAACGGRTDMFFSRNSHVAAQAVHLCRAHCPVLQSCAREAERLTPVGAVQAGIWYHDGNSQAAGPRKRQPAQVGCGPWCARICAVEWWRCSSERLRGQEVVGGDVVEGTAR